MSTITAILALLIFPGGLCILLAQYVYEWINGQLVTHTKPHPACAGSNRSQIFIKLQEVFRRAFTLIFCTVAGNSAGRGGGAFHAVRAGARPRTIDQL